MDSMKNQEGILAFDIGGTKVAYGVVENSRILYYDVVSTTALKKDPERFILETCKRVSSKVSYRAVILGVPAVVGVDGTVLSAPNLKEIERLNFKGLIQDECRLEVHIENDVNLSILGETVYGAARGAKYVFGVYVGTGLGAGIVINKAIYRGGSGAAAEIGHIYYPDGEGIVCGCGKVDCVELYASGKRLEEVKAARNCKSDSVFLCQEMKEEIDKFLKALSFAISTGANLLDPDVLVIGGGLVESKEFPWGELIKQIEEKTRAPLPREHVKIVKAQLGYKACLFGAYAYFISHGSSTTC